MIACGARRKGLFRRVGHVPKRGNGVQGRALAFLRALLARHLAARVEIRDNAG